MDATFCRRNAPDSAMTTPRLVAALLLALAATTAAAGEIPSSRSTLYYRLGGGDPASRAANPHGVPYNELHERGYPTLGCTHCTVPVPGAGPQDYSRNGRWADRDKTECGLHAVGKA